MTSITTKPFVGQKPGTSGLRKKVAIFKQPNYLENFVQSIFDTVPELNGGTLVLGGDGRYYNKIAIQTIIKMAAANSVKRVIIGQNGLLSTPAASHIIRKYQATGGIILSASHNPAGAQGDFGIKYNIANGGPAPAFVTDKIYTTTQTIDTYQIASFPDIDLSRTGNATLGDMAVLIIDPVKDYIALMEDLFDFSAISKMISNGFTLCFDAMHAITGPYAKAILEDKLGAAPGSVINGTPLPDFGGGHPDPNPHYAKDLFNRMFSKVAPDFGAASDGDGDRNIILGKQVYIGPSDSLAVLAANAELVPAYKSGLQGLARSMPTSRAVDYVAKQLGLNCFETPTGWKYFGNLLDDARITLCGEESAGTSSNHIREKDGLWAVLFWLNVLAVRGESVAEILSSHWKQFGRNYYTRYDYEGVKTDNAEAVMSHVKSASTTLKGKRYDVETVSMADSFSYHDPVDGSVAKNQGLRIEFESGSRIILRLSGTGTQDSTIRVYIDRYVGPDGELSLSTQEALSDLVEIALDITNLTQLTGYEKPSVIS